MTDLAILYRGSLSSCNYDCHYCPFAKQRDSRAELDRDRRQLERFVAWADRQTDLRLSVFLTPWGEALIRRWYCDAIARLSRMRHVRRVAAQTNLAFPVEWLHDARPDRVGLWCTWHPTQISRERFHAACRRLDDAEIPYSVGTVGIRENIGPIESLRRVLRGDVYLWVNAYKQPDYYDDESVRRLTAVDPLFPLNMIRYRSRDRACRTGETVISVDGGGDVRRCHFVRDVIGNIYDEPGWMKKTLRPRPCTADRCGCHIGYVHMPELRLYDVFEDGVLERLPPRAVWSDPALRDAAGELVEAIVRREAPLQVSIFGR